MEGIAGLEENEIQKMVKLGLGSWPIWLGVCGLVMGLEDWEEILAEGNTDYARACPDYKKYSTFAQ